MTTTKFPGWLSMPEAAAKYRVRYETVRRLAAAGVFTVGTFSSATKRPMKFLRVEELDAWKRGGVAAVEKVRKRAASEV